MELCQMSDPLLGGAATGSVISRDGTGIGYRQIGRGSGLVLLHGAMQTSWNFTRLAAALGDRFTLFIPDRRGRGLSGPFGDNYAMRTEVEDLNALLDKTGAHDVFGLSSGALVTLQAALVLPAIHRIAIYEPPLEIDGQPSPMDWVPRYDKDISAGNLAAAMVDIIKGTGDRALFTRLPRFVLLSLFKLAMRDLAKRTQDDQPPLQTLIPTVHFDTRLATEMSGRLTSFRDIRVETLLLGGARSAVYLTTALDALSTVLPNCKRIELPGLGHIAADNSGEPARVAKELRRYFS
jgi:pimeloyl-ACP methyl ester carboxylesterase